MKRVISTILALLCLVLCAFIVILWIRSYGGSDYVSRNKLVKIEPHALTSQRYALTFTRGAIRLSSEQHTYYPHATAPTASVNDPANWGYGRLGVGHLHWDDAPTLTLWNRLGFYSYETGWMSSFADSREAIIAFPAALPAIAFAVPPLLLVGRVMRQLHRRRSYLCANCGYDMRATPRQCPECGKSAAL